MVDEIKFSKLIEAAKALGFTQTQIDSMSFDQLSAAIANVQVQNSGEIYSGFGSLAINSSPQAQFSGNVWEKFSFNEPVDSGFTKTTVPVAQQAVPTATPEQVKDFALEQISENTKSALDLFLAQQDGQGLTSKSYDEIKDLMKTKLSGTKVSRAIENEVAGMNSLNMAKLNVLTKREYYNQNVQRLVEMLPGYDKFTDEQKESARQRILSLSLQNIKDFQHRIIMLPDEKDPQYVQDTTNIMADLREMTESMTFVKDKGDSQQIQSQIKINPPSVEMNTSELITFEEVYKWERGTAYTQKNIQDFEDKKAILSFISGASQKYEGLKTSTNEIQSAYDIATTETSTGIGAPVKRPEPQYAPREAQVLSLYEKYFRGSDGAQAFLQNLAKENKMGLEVKISSDGSLSIEYSEGIKTDAQKNAALNKLLDAGLQSQEAKLNKILDGKTYEQYQEDYSLAYVRAYGTRNAEELANAYKADQENFNANATGNLGKAGMGSIIVGGIVCLIPIPGAQAVGGTMIAVGGKAAMSSMVAKTALDVINEKTRKDGMSDEAAHAIIKEALINAGSMVVGMGAGATGAKVGANLLAKGSSELMAKVAERGVDFTISALGDMAMIGNLNFEGNMLGVVVSTAAGLKAGKAVAHKYGDLNEELKPQMIAVTPDGKYTKIPGASSDEPFFRMEGASAGSAASATRETARSNLNALMSDKYISEKFKKDFEQFSEKEVLDYLDGTNRSNKKLGQFLAQLPDEMTQRIEADFASAQYLSPKFADLLGDQVMSARVKAIEFTDDAIFPMSRNVEVIGIENEIKSMGCDARLGDDIGKAKTILSSLKEMQAQGVELPKNIRISEAAQESKSYYVQGENNNYIVIKTSEADIDYALRRETGRINNKLPISNTKSGNVTDNLFDGVFEANKNLISMQVSPQAAVSADDFCAEVFAGLSKGKIYSIKVMNLYAGYKGVKPKTEVEINNASKNASAAKVKTIKLNNEDAQKMIDPKTGILRLTAGKNYEITEPIAVEDLFVPEGATLTVAKGVKDLSSIKTIFMDGKGGSINAPNTTFNNITQSNNRIISPVEINIKGAETITVVSGNIKASGHVASVSLESGNGALIKVKSADYVNINHGVKSKIEIQEGDVDFVRINAEDTELSIAGSVNKAVYMGFGGKIRVGGEIKEFELQRSTMASEANDLRAIKIENGVETDLLNPGEPQAPKKMQSPFIFTVLTMPKKPVGDAFSKLPYEQKVAEINKKLDGRSILFSPNKVKIRQQINEDTADCIYKILDAKDNQGKNLINDFGLDEIVSYVNDNTKEIINKALDLKTEAGEPLISPLRLSDILEKVNENNKDVVLELLDYTDSTGKSFIDNYFGLSSLEKMNPGNKDFVLKFADIKDSKGEFCYDLNDLSRVLDAVTEKNSDAIIELASIKNPQLIHERSLSAGDLADIAPLLNDENTEAILHIAKLKNEDDSNYCWAYNLKAIAAGINSGNANTIVELAKIIKFTGEHEYSAHDLIEIAKHINAENCDVVLKLAQLQKADGTVSISGYEMREIIKNLTPENKDTIYEMLSLKDKDGNFVFQGYELGNKMERFDNDGVKIALEMIKSDTNGYYNPKALIELVLETKPEDGPCQKEIIEAALDIKRNGQIEYEYLTGLLNRKPEYRNVEELKRIKRIMEAKGKDGTYLFSDQTAGYPINKPEEAAAFEKLFIQPSEYKTVSTSDLYGLAFNKLSDEQKFGCKNYNELEALFVTTTDKKNVGQTIGQVKKSALDTFYDSLPYNFKVLLCSENGFTAKDLEAALTFLGKNNLLNDMLENTASTGQVKQNYDYAETNVASVVLADEFCPASRNNVNTMLNYGKDIDPKEHRKKVEKVNKYNKIATEKLKALVKVLDPDMTDKEIQEEYINPLFQLLYDNIDFVGEGNISAIVHNDSPIKFASILANIDTARQNSLEPEKMQQLFNSNILKDNDFKRFVNLAGVLIKNDEQKTAVKEIVDKTFETRFYDQGEVNLYILSELKNQSSAEIEFNDKSIEGWDTEYLPFALNAFDIPYKAEKQQVAKDLIKATLENKYEEFLYNPDKENGKLNIQTKHIYEEEGLDFDTWMKYDNEQRFTYTLEKADVDDIGVSIIEDVKTLTNDSKLNSEISGLLNKCSLKIDNDKIVTSSGQKVNELDLLKFTKQMNIVLNNNSKYLQEHNIQDIKDHFKARIKALEGNLDFKGGTEELSISLWKRDPKHDLFEGHYCQCCIALDGMNAQAILDSLSHVADNTVELKKADGTTVGKVKLLWMKDSKTNEPVLLANGFEIISPYSMKKQIREQFIEYLKGYSQEVAHKPVKIYTGTPCQKIPVGDLQTTDINSQLLGKFIDNTCHLDSYAPTQDTSWPNKLDEPKDLQLRVLYDPDLK